MKCAHCQVRKTYRAELCRPCHYKPAVRALYPCGPARRSGVSVENQARGVAAGPTDAPPGTEAKVAVLIERASQGVSLWHPADATWADRAARAGPVAQEECPAGDDEEEDRGP